MRQLVRKELLALESAGQMPPVLATVPTLLLLARFVLLRAFNRALTALLPVLDLRRNGVGTFSMVVSASCDVSTHFVHFLVYSLDPKVPLLCLIFCGRWIAVALVTAVYYKSFLLFSLMLFSFVVCSSVLGEACALTS
jgi:hypothetical protein